MSIVPRIWNYRACAVTQRPQRRCSQLFTVTVTQGTMDICWKKKSSDSFSLFTSKAIACNNSFSKNFHREESGSGTSCFKRLCSLSSEVFKYVNDKSLSNLIADSAWNRKLDQRPPEVPSHLNHHKILRSCDPMTFTGFFFFFF